MIKRHFLFALFFFIARLLSAQAPFAQISLKANPKFLFFLAINDSLVAPQAKSSFFINNLAIGPHHFQVISNESYFKLPFELNLSEAKKYDFELNELDGQLQIVPLGEGAVQDESSLIPKVKKGKNGKVLKVKNDELLGEPIENLSLDSLLLIADTKAYKGKKGCKYPISEIGFKEIARQIKSKTFEFERKEYYLEVIATHCFLAKQVYQLLLYFEFDDTKLSLLKRSKTHVFDIEGLSDLNKQLSLEKSRNELNEIITNF